MCRYCKWPPRKEDIGRLIQQIEDRLTRAETESAALHDLHVLEVLNTLQQKSDYP